MKKVLSKMIAVVLALTLVSVTIQVSHADGATNELRLRADGEGIVNFIQATLSGDYRVRSDPFRQRLSVDLFNINLDLGSPIHFCLVQNPGPSQTLVDLGTANVALAAGVKDAAVDFDTNGGDSVPTVKTGDRVEAYTNGGGCGSTQGAITATFQ